MLFFLIYIYIFNDKKILIIGSTGKLGKLLLNYCKKNNISIEAIASYKNYTDATPLAAYELIIESINAILTKIIYDKILFINLSLK